MLLCAAVTWSSFAFAEAPVAEAGLGLVAYVGDTVELNGSGSTDADGDRLDYAWTQTGGPPVDLTGADTAKPRFEVRDPGTLRFALVVSDGESDSAPDTVEFVVPHEAIDTVEAGCAAVAPGRLGLAVAGMALAVCLARGRR